jgi:hypothetical protein
MKKLTKKQRHDIYNKVLKMNYRKKERYRLGFCIMASEVLFGSSAGLHKINDKLFPEFFLFKPDSCLWWWWGKYSWDNNDQRQLALMFCIEMTK